MMEHYQAVQLLTITNEGESITTYRIMLIRMLFLYLILIAGVSLVAMILQTMVWVPYLLSIVSWNA